MPLARAVPSRALCAHLPASQASLSSLGSQVASAASSPGRVGKGHEDVRVATQRGPGMAEGKGQVRMEWGR